MRNFVIVLGLMISMVLPSFADVEYFSFEKGLGDAQSFKTNKSVNETEDFIDVTYTFEGATVKRTAEGEEFTMENAHYISTAGEPLLPYYSDMFLVPSLDSFVIEVVSESFHEFKAVDVVPSPGDMVVGESVKKDVAKGEIYSVDAFYPARITPVSSHHLFRGAPLLTVETFPIQFNPVLGVVRCYTSITYRIRLDQIKQAVILSEKAVDRVRDMVVNNVSRYDKPAPNYHPGKPVTYSIPENYLILTIPNYESVTREFAEWKTLMGFNCTVLSNSKWTPQLIRETVQSFYEDNSGIDYMLIVGDNGQIPAETFTFYDDDERIDILSDKRYACLTDSAHVVTDFSIGRITGSNAAEIKGVFDKIKEYELSPVPNRSFYLTGLHCAYFQDVDYRNKEEKPDGKAAKNYAFVQESEEIKDRLEKLDDDINVHRIYARQYEDVMPSIYGDGTPVPEELQKDYIWNGNASQVKQFLENQSAHYLLYHCHGQYDHWEKPYFTVNDARNLRNQAQPVVISSACYIGNFKYECLAEALLKNPKGGAVGLVANTHYGWSGCQTRIINSMMELLFHPDNQLSVADALESSLLTIGTDKIYSYPTVKHSRLSDSYLGDPSMRMYAYYPGCIVPTITQSGDTVVVSTGVPKCQITLVSQENPMDMSKFKTVKGVGSAKFTNVDYPFSICVKKAGYAPYCSMQNQYIQNKVLDMDSCVVNGNHIYVGKNVRAGKEQGEVICQSGRTELRAYGSIFLRDGFRVTRDAEFFAKSIVYRYNCSEEYHSYGPDINDNDPFVYYSQSTEIEDPMNNSSITLYPNPTDGLFNVRFVEMEGEKTVSIFSLDGDLLRMGRYKGESAEINLTGYPTGIYLVRIVSDNNVVTKRLFVK